MITYFASITVRGFFVRIQNGGYGPEHLQYKRFSIQQIELFDGILDCCRHKFVRLEVRVYLK